MDFPGVAELSIADVDEPIGRSIVAGPPAQSSLCPALKPLKLLTPSSRRNRSNKHHHKPAEKYPAVLDTRDRAEVHQSYLPANKTVNMSWAGTELADAPLRERERG